LWSWVWLYPDGFACAAAQLERGHLLTPIHTDMRLPTLVHRSNAGGKPEFGRIDAEQETRALLHEYSECVRALADGSLAPAAAESPTIPPMPEAIEVSLLSPLRLTLDNKLVGPAHFRPGDLLRALLRRVSMLMSFHTGADLETDFRALTDLANQARMAEAELSLAAQRRWSTNKADLIKMDGLLGGFLLDLRGLEPFWPYLWLGQWVHAGKDTVMGLGAIHLHEALDF